MSGVVFNCSAEKVDPKFTGAGLQGVTMKPGGEERRRGEDVQTCNHEKIK